MGDGRKYGSMDVKFFYLSKHVSIKGFREWLIKTILFENISTLPYPYTPILVLKLALNFYSYLTKALLHI
jgi:hypothetical protein